MCLNPFFLPFFHWLVLSFFSPFLALGSANASVVGLGPHIINNLFIIHHLPPPPRSMNALCHETSYSKREIKLKKREEKKEIFPFIPSSCRLGCRQISTQRLHIAVVKHNFGISPRSRVHLPRYAPCIPPHKPLPYTPIMHPSPCLPDIQTSFLQAVLLSINSPLP